VTQGDWYAAVELGRERERDRIRAELLKDVGGLVHYVEWTGRPGGTAVADPWVSAAELFQVIDRICPEER